MMKLIVFVLLLITVTTYYTHANPIYKDIKSIFQKEIKSLKEWQVYIDEFLELLIPVILSWDTNIENALFLQYKYVTYFAQKSKAVLPLYYYTPGSKIKMASGKMYLSTTIKSQLWEHLHYYKDDYYFQFAVTFNTDKKLSLNFTFHGLYFSRAHINSKTANLSLFELGSEKETQLSLSYSGYHAGFSIYPRKGSCLLITSVQVLILLVLNATFSVMDSNLVTTFHMTKYSQINLFSFWYIYENHVETNSFIQIIKTHRIILKLSQEYLHQCVVYDGPGSLSAIWHPEYVLGNEAYVYNCSSFQCLVKIISNNIKAIFVNYFATKLQTTLKRTIHNSSQLTLFGSKCNTKPCLFVFHAQSGYQVNITVLNMSYKSAILHMDCRYGGLSFKDGLHGYNYENVPFCKNHDSSTEASRSYYSRNFTLTIVFYTYDKYSESNVTLQLSPTKCKPVVLSLYEVQSNCLDNKSNSHCSKYFEQITEGTSLSLSIPFLEQLQHTHIVFSMSMSECLVLHVAHFYRLQNRMENEYGMHKTFTLASESIMNFGVKFHYQITGTLVQSISEWYYPTETINFIFIDETEKFCFRHLNKEFFCRKARNRSTCENSDEQFFGCEAVEHIVHATSSNNTHIFALATTKSPFTLQKFMLEFGFYKISESWIDVVIFKTTFDQGGGICGLKYQTLSDVIPFLPNKTVFNVKRFYSQDDSMLFFSLDIEGPDLVDLSVKGLEVGIKTEFNIFFETFMVIIYSMPIFKLNKGKVFSLPEKIDALKITLEEHVGIGISGKLNILWLHNNYIKFFKKSNPFRIQPQKCHTNANTYYDLGYRECFNITFVNSQYNYIIYSKEYSFFEFERLRDISGYISWSEASELCRNIGGHVPFFTSREQLDKLLALLKLSSEIHPIEALYIGLTSNAMVMIIIDFNKLLY